MNSPLQSLKPKQLGRVLLPLLGVAVSLLLVGLPRALAEYVFSYTFTVDRLIPDANDSGVVDVRSISTGIAGVTVTDVNVRLQIEGATARNGDFVVTLQHGPGYSVLLNRVGRTSDSMLGYGDAGLDIVFDDQAANGDVHRYREVLFGNPLQPIGGPLTGAVSGNGASWAPDGRNVDPETVAALSPRTAGLASFNGLPLDGSWRLHAADVASGGRGTLVGWTLEIRGTTDAANRLNLDGATVRAEGGTRSIGNPIDVSSRATFGGSERIVVSGQVAGTGVLEKTGSGTLVLNGANSFTGGVDVRSGTVAIGHDSALGRGELRLAGGSLTAEGGSRTLDNAVRLEGGASFNGSNPITFNNTATLEGQTQLTVNNRTVFNAPLNESSAGSRLVVSGSGTLVLRGASTYTGGTLVSGGRLFVNNTQGSATGSGAVDVRDGGVLGGIGTVAGPLTISNGGMISPGTSPGRTTTGSQTWGSGGTYEWEINFASTAFAEGKGMDSGYDWLDISNGVDPTLTIEATPLNPFTVKLVGLADSINQGAVAGFDNQRSYTWVLATAAGGIVGFDPTKLRLDTTSFVNNNPLGGGTFGLGVSGTDLRLQFVPVPEPRFVAVATAGLLLFAALMRRLQRKREMRGTLR